MKTWLFSAAALLALVGQERAIAQAPVAGSGTPVITREAMDYTPSYTPSGHVFAEVGFMILTPRWKDNPAIFIDQFNVGPDSRETSDQLDFDFGQQFVPKLSFGFVSAGGLGARMNWWGFASSRTASFTVPTPDGTDFFVVPAGPLEIQEHVFLNANSPGDTIIARAKLSMNVWDFEAVDAFQAGNWSLLGSLGIRYAHIAQRYDVDVIAGPTADLFGTGSIRSGHSFNGAGPTIALDGRRSIGNSSVFLYGNGRAAVLFGNAKQDAHSVSFSGAEGSDPGEFRMDTDAVISVTELEIGLGWARELGALQISAKAGFVGQIWYEAGNSSRSTGNSDAHVGVPQDNNLGLVGWTMNFGIGY